MGVLKFKTGPSLKLKTGPSFFHCFSPLLKCFGVFLKTQIVSHCAKIVWDVKHEVVEKKTAFLFLSFYVGEIETEKRKTNKMEKAQKPYKNRFFWRLSSKNVKTIPKKLIFSKNCLTLFVSGRERKRAFSCTRSVLAKIFFRPKQCKPGRTIKIVVSAEIAKKQK